LCFLRLSTLGSSAPYGSHPEITLKLGSNSFSSCTFFPCRIAYSSTGAASGSFGIPSGEGNWLKTPLPSDSCPPVSLHSQGPPAPPLRICTRRPWKSCSSPESLTGPLWSYSPCPPIAFPLPARFSFISSDFAFYSNTKIPLLFGPRDVLPPLGSLAFRSWSLRLRTCSPFSRDGPRMLAPCRRSFFFPRSHI